MDQFAKRRAVLVGILIIAAYTMLTYDITGSKLFGFITDEISGLAVIGIPLLLYPLFKGSKNKWTKFAYVSSRIIEGLLMLIGGFVLILGMDDSIRAIIYGDIHIWFFIIGALTFYLLLLETGIIPKFVSIWGLIATGLLFVITVLGLFGIESTYLSILLLPMILNELFLAFWLIFKGFTNNEI